MTEWSEDAISICTNHPEEIHYFDNGDGCPRCLPKTEYTSFDGLVNDIKKSVRTPEIGGIALATSSGDVVNLPEMGGMATVFSVEAMNMPKAKKNPKQRSKHEVIDGIVFDSKLEGRRYRHLKELQLSGIIRNLRPSIGNEIKKNFVLTGKITLPANSLRKEQAQRAITYTPDFVYVYKGITVIEDVKGTYGNSKRNREKGIVGKPIIGADARLRHKLLQAEHPHSVFTIVTNPNSDAGKAWSE